MISSDGEPGMLGLHLDDGVGVPGVAEESRSLVSRHRLGHERLFIPASHSVLDVVLRELGLLQCGDSSGFK